MNKQDFDELLASIREAGKILKEEQEASREFTFNPLDVKKIREKTGLSQRDFSTLVHVSLRTLQNWEQGKRSPTGPAVALLTIIKNDPLHAIKALH
ncbi:MAG TPA: transcriptional regulator [Legionellales bacterium]|jgi:putative transcriptional regulator|nr:transcriptional regulator [Legionellales bacterium]